MNLRVVLRIASVFGLALLAAVVLRGMFIASSTPPAPPPPPAIQVAAAKLAVGTLLRADDLVWHEVGEAGVQKGQITKDSPTAARLPGAVVRRPIEEGAPITEKDVVFPDAPGFLAAALQPGLRAVSVAIDEVTGNAGLTMPGDRVDLILTHHMTDTGSGDTPPKVASETVLADVRVIAVGSVLHAPDTEAPPQRQGNAASARTVTLEVTPRDAESVAVASRLGQLSLALRSLAVSRSQGPDSEAPADLSGQPVWGRDVSAVVRMTQPRPAAHAVAASGPARVQVFRGSDGAK
ncbi:MAG: Flp pilus assembly protein CpaB [Magnetospirillum sp.]|nr:Flp pilus assembly protein CpaB [Magnetospirillum sp.]